MAKSPFAKMSMQGGYTRPASGNKFGAIKAECQAKHMHASKGEARRCDELHLLQRGGAICNLEQQPQFWFVINGQQVLHEGGRRVGYKADFGYFDAVNGLRFNSRQIIEDSKGAYRDRAWTLRKAIFQALFPAIELRETK